MLEIQNQYAWAILEDSPSSVILVVKQTNLFACLWVIGLMLLLMDKIWAIYYNIYKSLT